MISKLTYLRRSRLLILGSLRISCNKINVFFSTSLYFFWIIFIRAWPIYPFLYPNFSPLLDPPQYTWMSFICQISPAIYLNSQFLCYYLHAKGLPQLYMICPSYIIIQCQRSYYIRFVIRILSSTFQTSPLIYLICHFT